MKAKLLTLKDAGPEHTLTDRLTDSQADAWVAFLLLESK